MSDDVKIYDAEKIYIYNKFNEMVQQLTSEMFWCDRTGSLSGSAAKKRIRFLLIEHLKNEADKE